MLKTITQYGLNEQKVKQAIDFVYSCDATDGFTQADCGTVTAIRTSIFAIAAGLHHPDKDIASIYEAVVMLQQIINKIELNRNPT